VFNQPDERGSAIVVSNLPFDARTGVFRSERLVESVPYEPIPYASEQGIFCALTGN